MVVLNNSEQLMKLGLLIVIPVTCILIIYAIIRFIFSKKIKEKDEKYVLAVNYYNVLLVLVISCYLAAITCAFMHYITNYMRAHDLVEAHNILYYFGLIFPVLPVSIVVFLSIKFVKVFKRKEGIYEGK